MFEEELIEQLNDIDNRWRDKFDDIWTAAEYHGLLHYDSVCDDYDYSYDELNFN